MRIPRLNSTVLNLNNTELHEEMEIDVDNLPDVEMDFEIDMENPKTFPKVIKAIKTLVRNSTQYRRLVVFLKDKKDMDKSFFFKGIKNSKDKRSTYSIELHHTPFVLEDIVVTVIRKRMAMGESLDYLKIAKEIIFLHYIGVIGLAPLDKTMHTLIHSPLTPDVFIPLQYIPFGDCHEFFEAYREYIPDNVKVSYLYLQNLSLKYEKISDAYPDYLKPKYLYYKGFMDMHKFEELAKTLEKDRLIRSDE